MAEKYHRTPAQVILRWNIQRNVGVIPKSTKIDRIVENFKIFDFELTQMDVGVLHNYCTCRITPIDFHRWKNSENWIRKSASTTQVGLSFWFIIVVTFRCRRVLPQQGSAHPHFRLVHYNKPSGFESSFLPRFFIWHHCWTLCAVLDACFRLLAIEE